MKEPSPETDKSASVQGESGAVLAVSEGETAAPPLPGAEEVPAGTMASAAELDSLLADTEVSFVLLPGDDDTAGGDISNRLTQVLFKLEEQGKAAEAFILTPKAAGYSQWILRQGVESLPSVVVFHKGSRSAVVSGDLSESSLLRSYLQATRTTPGCGAAAESSDKPCDCGQ